MPFSPAEIELAILQRIPVKTGISLEEWARLARENGPKHVEHLKRWLQEEHGLNHTQSTILVKSWQKADSPVFVNQG